MTAEVIVGFVLTYAIAVVVVAVVGVETVSGWFGIQAIWDWLMEISGGPRPVDSLPAVDWCQGCDHNFPRECMEWSDDQYRCLTCIYGPTELKRLRGLA
nr:hypothetical protein [Mycobacterium sp. UM_NZ2]